MNIIRPTPHSIWKHHSGDLYRVVTVANEDADPGATDWPILVVYQSIKDGKIWARPLTKWSEEFQPEPIKESWGKEFP